MTTLSPTPEAVIHLVKCRCAEVAASAAKQSCRARTFAALPMMMNVRINKARMTMMIPMRMKKMRIFRLEVIIVSVPQQLGYKNEDNVNNIKIFIVS